MKSSWAVITGASSGIGLDFARQLGERGVNLILVARRKERLEEIKSEISGAYNVEVDVCPLDLSKPEAPRELFDFSVQNGREIQILINNAGIGNYGEFLSYELEDHMKTIDLNIVSLTKLTYLFIKHMKDHGKESYLTNVSSIASFQPVPKFGVYCATKYFVTNFSQTLGHEFKDTNIHITCVAPGGTYTEFLDSSNQSLNKMASMGMMSSKDVAKIGLNGMFAKRRTVVTGLMNKVFTLIPRLLPMSLTLHLGETAMNFSVTDTREVSKS